MRKTLSVCCVGLGLVLGGIWPAHAQDLAANEIKLTIALHGHMPPMSDDLATFIVVVREAGSGVIRSQLVGLNATDIGQGGPVNGANEAVPMSFVYPAFSSITSAILSFTLTPRNLDIRTDSIAVIDVPQEVTAYDPYMVYGNDVLQNLQVGQEYLVQFDLQALDVNTLGRLNGGHFEPLGQTDLTPFLLDGQLDLVYQDDAVVHSATLTIIGTSQATLTPPLPQEILPAFRAIGKIPEE